MTMMMMMIIIIIIIIITTVIIQAHSKCGTEPHLRTEQATWQDNRISHSCESKVGVLPYPHHPFPTCHNTLTWNFLPQSSVIMRSVCHAKWWRTIALLCIVQSMVTTDTLTGSKAVMGACNNSTTIVLIYRLVRWRSPSTRWCLLYAPIICCCRGCQNIYTMFSTRVDCGVRL